MQEKKDRTELIEKNWTAKMSSLSAYFSRWWLHAGRAACSAASPLAARFTPSAGEGCLLFSYASPDTILPRATTLTACVFVRYWSPVLDWVSLFIDRIRACVLSIYIFGISHSPFSDFSRCVRSRTILWSVIFFYVNFRVFYRLTSTEIPPFSTYSFYYIFQYLVRIF